MLILEGPTTKACKNVFKDVLFITRGNNERTMLINNQILLENGIPQENIMLVVRQPSYEAVLESFTMAVTSNFKFMYRVDGDIIIDFNQVVRFVEEAKKLSNDVFVVMGFVHCKIFGIWRFGGNFFYKISLLKDINRNDVINNYRPDSTLHKNKQKQGFKIYKLPYKIGYHAYEQYNYDLYNIGINQALKHKKYSNLLLPRWFKLAEYDSDFKFLLQGFIAEQFDKLSILKNEQSDAISEKSKIHIEKFDLNNLKNGVVYEIVTKDTSFLSGGVSSKLYDQNIYFKRLKLKYKILNNIEKITHKFLGL